MNERFYSLPEERQQQMVNAGYKVFATFPYKKAPMSSIADAAGISKPLLFHYFGNKKELYLYLFELAIHTTEQMSDNEGLIEEKDFFSYLQKTLIKEIRLMSVYPCLFLFLRTAYYEKDPDVVKEISKLKSGVIDDNAGMMLNQIDRTRFKDPNAPEVVLELFTLVIEGFMNSNSQFVFRNPDAAIEKLNIYLDSLKANYYK